MSSKTRHSSGPKISEFLGGGKPLLPTELPTVRACMKAALHLQEEKFLVQEVNRKDYTVHQRMEDWLPLLKIQWEKANCQLKQSVLFQDKTIVQKLENYWGKVSDITNGRLNNKKKKEEFMLELEKLLDLTRCRCVIKSCEEANCDGCKQGALITCNCIKEVKLPKIELFFIREQRNKVGDLSSVQIATKDSILKSQRDLKNKRTEKKERLRKLQSLKEKRKQPKSILRISKNRCLNLKKRCSASLIKTKIGVRQNRLGLPRQVLI